jgi:hypothetical protein
MKRILLLNLIILGVFSAHSQNVGIGTNNPDPSAKLEINATNMGLLPPRVELTAINEEGPISSPALGLLVYNLVTAGSPPNVVNPGYYFWDGAKWVSLDVQNDKDWFKAGTTDVADDIEDDIYTQGRVGIGTQNPEHVLHIVETGNSGLIAGLQIDESNGGQALIINESGNGAGILINSLDNGSGIISTTEGAVTQNAGGVIINELRTSSSADLLKVGLDVISSGVWNGTNAQNIGLRVDVSGGTNNYAALFNGGNVGIGTTAPIQKLEIFGGTTYFRAAPNFSTEAEQIRIGRSDSDIRYHSIFSIHGTGSQSNLQFRIHDGGPSPFTGQTTVMTLTGEGRVGIGTTAPSEAIHIIGNTRISGLAGTGNRAVYADANGVLIAGSKNMVYLEDRNQRNYDASNVGYRDASAETANLPVNTGDVVIINYTGKFKFTNGSGNDDVRFRIQVLGDCGTINLADSHEYEDYDNNRNEFLPVGGYFVYVPTCSGNIRFKLQVDGNTDSDDNHAVGDIVLVAVKY